MMHHANNVTRLPTAADRKVSQRSVAAVRAYKAAHPWPGSYRRPGDRQAESMVADAGRSPELLLVLAMLKVMDAGQRQAVKDVVLPVQIAAQDDVSLRAYSLISSIAGERS